MPGVGGRPDHCPERQGAKVIQGEAPALSLRCIGLCLSVAPILDGVMDVMVITDLVVHGGTPRGKVAPLLLPRLGAPSPWLVEAVARGVTAASPHRRGMSVGVVPIGGGHRLG